MRDSYMSDINNKLLNNKATSQSIDRGFLDEGFYPLLKKTCEVYGDPMVILNLKNHLIMYVNNAFLQMFQYSLHDLINSKIDDIHFFEDASEINSVFNLLHEYGFVDEYEFNVKTKSEEIKTLVVNVVSETINNELYAMCVLKDVTRKKDIEHVLRTHQKQLATELNNKTHELVVAETVLKERLKSEKCFADMVRNAPIGIGIGFSDGRMELPNEAFANLLGYTIEELKNIDWIKDTTPENWIAIEASHLSKLTPDNNVITYEKECIQKNGSLIPIEINVKAIYDEQYELINYIVVLTNISEIKLATQALKDNSEMVKGYFDASTQPIAVIKNGMFLKANKAYCGLFGYDSFDELRNKPIVDMVLSTEHDRMLSYIKRRELGEDVPSKYTTVGLRKDGSTFPLDVNITEFEQNGTKLQCVFLNDLTQKLLYEKQLFDIEEKYHELIENALMAASTTTFDGEVIFANKTYANMLGFKSVDDLINKNVLGNNDSSFGWKYPLEREKMTKILKADGFINNYNVQLIANDGKEIQILLSATVSNNLIYGLFMDISKEKEVEKKIKDNEERYKALYNNSIAALVRTDVVNGNPIEANKAAASLFGYASVKEFKENFNSNHHFIKPDRKTLLKELINKGHLENFEIKCKAKDGNTIWLEACIKLDRENKFIDWVLIDITDKANERAENLKLSTALDQSPECICITDKFGTIEYANKRFSELTGYTNDELIGSNPSVLNSGYQDKAFYDNLWNTILSGNVWNGEMYNKKKNGDLFWENGSIAPIFDDNNEITHFVAVKEDITAKKQTLSQLQAANEKIRESEKFYRGLINNLNAGIIVHDKDAAILMSNNRASELLGLSREQLNGKKAYDSDWHLVDINNVKLAYEAYPLNIIKTTKKSVTNNLIGVERPATKDVVWLIINGFPVLDSNGDIKEIVLSFADFTARKLAEDQLVAAKEKAEESDKLKSAFLSNMSHEIRTPMNGILGFTNLLKDNDLSGEEQKEYIELIEESGDRMLSTIQDIIDISRIETGGVAINYSDVNLNEQVHYIRDLLRFETKKKGLELICKNGLSDKEATVSTDKQKLNSIITNLVKNAIKYTNVGSVTFGYKLKNDDNKKLLEIYVEDTGIGIPINKQDVIFDRFMQADISENRAYEGSGLGLSIAKAYVEMLNGKIWVESEERLGSKFFVSLPYESIDKNIEVVVTSDSFHEASLENRKLKILITDDDKLVKVYLGIVLKGVNAELFYAENGLEAIEIVKRQPNIDLILMDVMMPGIDGFETTRSIREFNKEAYVIIQTAFTEKGTQEKAMACGANDYITKPIEKKKLLNIISTVF